MTFWSFSKIPPVLASAEEDMTVLIVLNYVRWSRLVYE